MALPPPTDAGDTLTHDLLNSLRENMIALLAGQDANIALLNQHTETLSAIQNTQAQQAEAIDHLQQITDTSQAPLPPSGLAQVTASQTDLTVSWTAVSGNNITYLVEWEPSDDDEPVFTALPATAATQATISGLTAGTNYAVRVSTIAGTFTGPPGTPVIFTTIDAPAVPLAPVVTTVGAPTTTSVTVAWNAVANATQYEAGYLIATVWTSIITTPATTLTATFTGLAVGTAYTVQVRGDNGATLGSLSAPIVATTAAAGPTPPAQVTGGVASGATTSTIDYAWTAFPASGTPPTDPGVAAPALTIAPGSVAYKFNNLAFQSTATDDPAFHAQVIDLTCTKGQLSFTPVGTATVRAGAQNSNFVSISALWPDLISSAATITYRSPAALANDSDSILVQLWFAGSAPTPATGTIPITIIIGATTSETGGYNATGGVSYVPSISANTGTTWTAFPKQTDNSITFTGLTASHLYQFRVHAVSLANISGIDSTVSSLSTTAVATNPGVIGDPTGTQAARAGDFFDTFGVNAYPMNQQDNVPRAEVSKALTYMYGGTGHRAIVRFYSGIGGAQGPACVTQYNALIASNNILAAPCVDHFGGTQSSAGVIYCMNNMPASAFAYVEGVNEPNTTSFGTCTPAQARQVQQEIYGVAHPKGIKVALASVLFQSSTQVNWWGGEMAAALAASDYSCSHHYPNSGCYSASNELTNYTNPTNQHTTWVMTETDPNLYNPPGGVAHAGYQKANFNIVGGWHFLCGWTIGYFKRNLRGMIWWTLFDYHGYPENVGLFQATGPTGAASAPWRHASQIRILANLIKDTATNRRTFTAGKINCTVTGLPAGSWVNSGGMLNWLQTANGDFWGLLQNEQNQLSATTSTVHLAFGTNCTLIEDFPVTGTGGTQTTVQPARTTLHNVNAIDVVLGTEYRVIHVKKI